MSEPDTPTLTAAQKADLINWASRRSRPGTGGDLDELHGLVAGWLAGWLAEARAEAWAEGADAVDKWHHYDGERRDARPHNPYETSGSEGDPAGGWLPRAVENGTNDVASPEPRYPVTSPEVTVTYPPRGRATP